MKKTIRLSIVLASFMLLATFSQLVYARYASTEPWPMYRHDLARTGTITSTAPDSNQTLLWSHGRSTTKSHIVADGMVIIISSTYVYALDETTGVEIWSSISFPNALTTTPTYNDGRIYVGASSGDLLYFGCDDGKLYALNISQTLFSLKWTYTVNNSVRCTPTVDTEKVYFGSQSTDHSVFALNKTTGTLVWKYTLTNSWYIDNPMVVVNGMVYVAPSYGNKIYALYANATPGTYLENAPEIKLWRSEERR